MLASHVDRTGAGIESGTTCPYMASISVGTKLDMHSIQVPRVLTLAMFATAALSSARAQTSSVQNFQIHVIDPAYAGLPVWIYAELRYPLEIHYPYGEDPGDFGPNKLEVKRENQVLEQVPFKPRVGRGGVVDGWIAPPSSPKNRLPLHLQ